MLSNRHHCGQLCDCAFLPPSIASTPTVTVLESQSEALATHRLRPPSAGIEILSDSCPSHPSSTIVEHTETTLLPLSFEADAAFQPLLDKFLLACWSSFAHSFCETAFPWAQHHSSGVMDCLQRSRPPRVQFCDAVDFHCWTEEEHLRVTVLLQLCPQQFRTCWHLHGQCCEASIFLETVNSWSQEATCFGPSGIASLGLWDISFCSMCLGARRCNDEPWVSNFRPDIVLHPLEGWEEVGRLMAGFPQRSHFFIETWYLAAGRFEVCARPRRVLVTRDMTPEHIQRTCLFLWKVILGPGPAFRLVPVVPKPESWRLTVAHYILIQEPSAPMQGILLQCDSFPVLQTLRAVLVNPMCRVDDLFHAAQGDRHCGARAACFAFRAMQPEHRVGTFEHIQVRDGDLVHGDIRTLVEDTDSASSDDEDSEEDSPDSTHLPSVRSSRSEDDNEDEDCSSLISMPPSWASNLEPRVASEPGPQSDRTLFWAEIPWQYHFEDIFSWDGPRPSWLHAHPDSQEDDVASFMNRGDRSRSRDRAVPRGPGDPSQNSPAAAASEEDSDSPPEDAHSQEESQDELPQWRLAYTDMPFEPVPIAAGEEGPTPAQAATALSFPPNSVAAVHPVRYLDRANLDLVALVECVGDRMNHGREAMVLLDLLCLQHESPESPPAQLQHSVMIPQSSITVAEFAESIRLSRIFRLHRSHLHIFHNGEPWDLDGTQTYRLVNGDYLEVVFDAPTCESFRVDLVDWLRDEGVDPEPHLLTPIPNATISPTLPFDIEEPSSSSRGRADAEVQCGGHLQLDVLTFNSWYISHVHHVICRDSRPLLFSSNPERWRNSVQQTWADRFDAGRPFTITFFLPQPRDSGRIEVDLLPHVLIEQHAMPRCVGTLISVVDHRGSDRGARHTAHSTDFYLPKAGFLQLAEIDDVCSRTHVCTVRYDDYLDDRGYL